MSIEPGTMYDSLTLYRTGNVLWTIQGPISADLIAGLSTGIFIMIDLMSKDTNFHYEATEVIEIIADGGKKVITINFLPGAQIGANLERKMGDYIIVTKAKPENYMQYNPMMNNYTWWIDNYAEGELELDINTKEFILEHRYIVFQFSSPDFIQGFITICNAFGVDFRDFTLGYPFTYNSDTHQRTNHNITGYDITPFNVRPRIPAPIGPYYIEGFEDDPNAVDYN